jgi:hypothetical protein
MTDGLWLLASVLQAESRQFRAVITVYYYKQENSFFFVDAA